MDNGQGLPLSFIVIAAISALVLILVIAFTIGGLGGFFKQIVAPAPTDLSTVQTSCTSFCNTAQTTAQTVDQFKNSDFCKKTFAIDLNKNGKIDTGESGLHCKDTAVTVTVGTESTTQTGPSATCSIISGGTSLATEASC